MTRILGTMLIVLALAPLAARPAAAQEGRVGRATIGGAVGVAGGTVVTLSVIVARARFQREYLDSVEDLIHWQSTPMILAPAAGAVFGLAGTDALRGSVVGSTTGMAVGAVVGAGLGWLVSAQQESPWAGGVMGAGLGLSIGGLFGGLRAWSEDDDAELEFPSVLRMGLTLPVR